MGERGGGKMVPADKKPARQSNQVLLACLAAGVCARSHTGRTRFSKRDGSGDSDAPETLTKVRKRSGKSRKGAGEVCAANLHQERRREVSGNRTPSSSS